MKRTQLGPNLVQLTKYPALFPMNCFVFTEPDGLTLVDSTMSSVADDVDAEAKRQGKELRRILLTHAHGDHVGGVAGVRQRFPEVEVWMSERDAALLAGNKAILPGEEQTPVKGYFVTVDWKPDRLFKDGDRIGSVDVVASPGHTPGHVSFLDTRDRALVAGDAFQTRGGMAVSGVLRPLFPFPAMATWSKHAAAKSAAILRGLNPSVLAVGHGDAIKDPGAAMDAGIAEAQRRLPE